MPGFTDGFGCFRASLIGWPFSTTNAAAIADHVLVRGDGGGNGIQGSGITCSDQNRVSWTTAGLGSGIGYGLQVTLGTTGTESWLYGINVYSTGAAANNAGALGVQGTAYGPGAANTLTAAYGLYGQGDKAYQSIGVYGLGKNTSGVINGLCYGGRFEGQGSARALTCYGAYGFADNATGVGYGLYGAATNSGTNWAGYFADGNVYITNYLQFAIGATINEFSIDGTMAGNSDIAVPTEKAVKTYVANNAGGMEMSLLLMGG